ncbi:MAG: hypothetical protein M1822_003695 [Bathelium mastoideum]|nr:MAG: hypothetical protein M1822_003695 [Bathelium mastoideum]
MFSHIKPHFLLALIILLKSSLSTSLTLPQNQNTPLPVAQIFQFPRGGYVEGLAFRSNGKLLGTLLNPEASIYQFDTTAFSARKVTTIPYITGLYGITETTTDQFYVAGGNLSLTASTRDLGSFRIWHVNLTSFDSEGQVEVQETTRFANATPNGLWTLDAERGVLLATDSTNGVVYRVDVATGENRITIDDQVLKPPANATTYPSPNGIAVRGGYLYFTNTGAGTFGRVPIDAEGVQSGPGEVLAVLAGGNPGGDVFVAGNPNNWLGLLRATRDGTFGPIEIVAGGTNRTDLLGPNTARFGVSDEDTKRRSLFIGTSGGLPQYRSGIYTNGGGVYRVDTGVLGLS